jgi:hypothetical protein
MLEKLGASDHLSNFHIVRRNIKMVNKDANLVLNEEKR